MDQLIFASLSHTHYWYEVGMLKIPGVHTCKHKHSKRYTHTETNEGKVVVRTRQEKRGAEEAIE